MSRNRADAMERPVVTLMTDFGTRDGYAGAVKGVILSLCPSAALVDITHDIGAGDIAEAAFVLETYHDLFPAGTVHLVVVDPGVGGPRRALAVSSGGRWYVGPDNGVFVAVYNSPVGFVCRELTSPAHRRNEISAVFHGRDIFAPAAAFLASGGDWSELGPPVMYPVRPERKKRADCSSGCIAGKIIHVDHFGNLVTDITVAELRGFFTDLAKIRVRIAGREVHGLSEYYSQSPAGELVALASSHGRLEIAASGASAEKILGGALRGAVARVSAIEA